MKTPTRWVGALLAAALAGCGGSDDAAELPAEGAPSPVADAAAASVVNPASPPPIGTDVGAAQGDTASVVVDTAEASASP